MEQLFDYKANKRKAERSEGLHDSDTNII